MNFQERVFREEIKMRRLCLMLMVGALCALPGWAQEGDDQTKAKKTSDDSAAAAPATSDSNAAPAAARSFAVPDPPRPNPFPAASPMPTPAASGTLDDSTPGRWTPKYELAGMYSYVNFNPGNSFPNFNNNGGTGSFTYNLNSYLGLTAEAGFSSFSRRVVPAVGKTEGGFQTFMAGPRLKLRRGHFVPFP